MARDETVRARRANGGQRVEARTLNSGWSLLACGLMLGLGVFTLSGCPTPPPGEKAAHASATRSDIDVTELKARMDRGKIVLIDVRTDREWQSGHVPGALHRPLATLDPGAFETGPVHVICASGGRSSTAADTLTAAGVDAVNVLGGTTAWRAAGHPVQ